MIASLITDKKVNDKSMYMIQYTREYVPMCVCDRIPCSTVAWSCLSPAEPQCWALGLKCSSFRTIDKINKVKDVSALFRLRTNPPRALTQQQPQQLCSIGLQYNYSSTDTHTSGDLASFTQIVWKQLRIYVIFLMFNQVLKFE